MQIDKHVLLNKCLKTEQAFPNLKDNYSLLVLIRTLIVKYCVEKPGVLFVIVIFEESNHKDLAVQLDLERFWVGMAQFKMYF